MNRIRTEKRMDRMKLMKRFFCAANVCGHLRMAALLFLILSLLPASQMLARETSEKAPAATGPRIVIQSPNFDGGIVKPHSTVTGEYLVENQGDSNLVILKVKPT